MMMKQRFDDLQRCLPTIMGNTVIRCLLGFEVVVVMMMMMMMVVVVVVDLELTDEEVSKQIFRKKCRGKKRLETPTMSRCSMVERLFQTVSRCEL